MSSPSYSADWRFLLPIAEGSQVLIVGGEHDDFTQFFSKIGVSTTTWLCGSSSFWDERTRRDNIDRGASALADLSASPFPPASFDIVAIPFGFSSRNSAGRQHDIEAYQTVRRLIRPGGTLLVGFSNIWGIRRRFRPESYYSTPWRIIRRLRHTGYSSIDLYGVMPNLNIPEYIFPLTTQALGFTLQHRYRYKLPANFLRWFSNSLIVSVFSKLLSGYFVVAKINGSEP